jgi:hypothetical protein
MVNVIFCCSELKVQNLRKKINTSESIVIISTDAFYDNEKNDFQLIYKHIEFYTFVDFLSDKEFESIDYEVINKCKKWVDSGSYYTEYVRLQKYVKLCKIYNKLIKQYQNPRFFYHTFDLGISREFILEKHISNLGEAEVETKSRWNLARLKRILNFRSPAAAVMEDWVHKVDLFFFEDKYYLILNGLKRLRSLKGELIYQGYINLKNYKSDILALIPNVDVENLVVCVEIHQYSHSFSKIFTDLVLLIDSYQPPNYTRSYFEMYSSSCSYGCLSKMDELFFESNSLKIDRTCQFLESSLRLERLPEMNLVKSEISTVVLLLQCTSEWTALINRSDVNSLVNVFIKLAGVNPNIDFIIRPHPLMTIPQHDGVNSVDRIINYINFMNLKNITVSDRSLEDDITRANLFIAEYSTTLFDAMIAGKIWISCNVTGRRNYFEPFSSLGFLHAESYSELESLFKKVMKKDATLIREFSNAKQKLKWLNAWN